MKVSRNLPIIVASLLMVIAAQAQFTTSSSQSSKNNKEQVSPEYNRKQDIALLTQWTKTLERDFMSGDAEGFNNHKSEVLKIMDREISRSAYDFKDMKEELKAIDPDSQEGRVLRIGIMQMEDRINKQKYIRTKVSEQKLVGVNVENAKELSGFQSQYNQFIDSMKTNLKSIEGSDLQSGNTEGKPGSSNSTTSGKTSNMFYLSSTASSSDENKEELPESYYRSADKQAGETYIRTKKSTATALSNTTKEIQYALDNEKAEEVTKLLGELTERIQSDISADKMITDRLDKGELKYSGLNAGLIKNNSRKKTDLLKKVEAIKLPGQKSKLFSLVSEYIQLLN